MLHDLVDAPLELFRRVALRVQIAAAEAVEAARGEGADEIREQDLNAIRLQR